MIEKRQVEFERRVQDHILPQLFVQGEAKLAQSLDLFHYIQYKISGRCSLSHLSIKNGITNLVPLNIVGSTKKLSQHLEHVL